MMEGSKDEKKVGHLSQFEPFANFMAVSSNLIFSGDVG
jgi:hypothetical protein